MKKLLVIALCVLVSACAAPKFTGSPVQDKKQTIVVIKDNDTRTGFLETIKGWLTQNGYDFSVVEDGSQHDLEKLTLEYNGVWKWDLALFLHDAKVNAFHGGQKVGTVHYRAPSTLNFNKFSDAEERISRMLDILFGKVSVDKANQLMLSVQEDH